MGFSSYSKSNKDNRRLQKGISSGYFKQQNPIKIKLNTNSGSSLDKRKLNKAIRLKKISIIKQVFFFIGISGILMVFLFKFFNKQIINYRIGYKQSIVECQELKLNEERSEIEEANIQSYNHYVDLGREHFQNGNIDAATRNYFYAREYFDHGKDANLGLAIAYAYDCKYNMANCALANQYYDVAKRSPSVTKKDLALLQFDE